MYSMAQTAKTVQISQNESANKQLLLPAFTEPPLATTIQYQRYRGGLGNANLAYSEGIGSTKVAIPFLKVMQREKLCTGKLKCTAGAPFKSPMNVHIL